jgi:hypothetical protein
MQGFAGVDVWRRILSKLRCDRILRNRAKWSRNKQTRIPKTSDELQLATEFSLISS